MGGGDDFLGGVEDVVAGDEVEPAFLKCLLTCCDIVALESNDEGNVEADFLGSRDDAFGDDVAVHDAAEDVDEDGFHVGVAGDDLEGRCDLFLGGTTSDVEEVGGVASGVLDDVHGGHRETGSVDEASDVAVEADVVEVVFARRDFAGVFLVLVTVGHDVGVAVEGVVVEAELGVEGEDAAVGGFHQRVDLDHRAVALEEKLVEVAEEFGELLAGVLAEAETLDHLANLVALKTGEGVDELLENLFRAILGHFFDIHSTFDGGHDDGAGGGAVHEDGEVVFVHDFDRFGDHDFADELAFVAGLLGDEGLANHFASDFTDFDRVGVEVDAALEAVLEGAFAATSSVDLCFDDIVASSDFFGDGLGFGGCFRYFSIRARHAELFEQLFGLILVNIHFFADAEG